MRAIEQAVGTGFGVMAFVLAGLQPASAGDTVAGSAVGDGPPYRIEKTRVGEEEVKTFLVGDRSFTAPQFRAFLAAQPPQVLTPTAQELLESSLPGDSLDLLVILREQPAAPISREVLAGVDDEIGRLTREIREITRRSLPTQPMTPEQERSYEPVAPAPGDLEARRELSQQLDDLQRDARQDIAQRIAVAVAPSQARLSAFVAQLGGEVYANVTSMNILGIRLRSDRVTALASHPLVAFIDADRPGQHELDNHQHSLGLVTGFWAGGIDGGVHDVGVLDTGVEQNHPALSSHNFLSNMGTHDTSYHGTGMAGILASTNSTYPGMAYGCDTIVVARAGSITTSMPGMDYIASTGEPENVNYSFGNGTATDMDYSPTDQFFDGVIDTFGFMVSKSTGNGGWGVTTITHPAPAYNLMATANMDDKNTVTRNDDVITSSSSTGPTKGGRKKPDITAPGTNSMSCHPNGGFSNIGGTSSASPHTGGGIVLLYDMGVTSVMAGKAILINTAEAIDDNGTSGTGDDYYVNGSRWNHRYGWGYLNLGAAYLHGLDVFLDEIPDSPEDADFRLYKGPMFTWEKATLVWQRHVAYNGATFPTQIEDLSDLELFAFRETDNTLLADSGSAIDNVEQLHVEENGDVVLKVEAFGQFDPDVPLEQFALATQENFVEASGPSFGIDFTLPASVAPGEQFQIEADVNNIGDVTAHDVSAELSGVTIVSGANPALLGSITDGSSAKAIWTVQAANANGTYPIEVEVTSSSYGETFTGLGQTAYQVGDCPTPTVYGQAKVNSQGCTPAIGWTGTPSLSSPDPFDIAATDVINNQFGILLYGYQPASIPFFGGTLLIKAPHRRTPVQFSGGNPPPDDCSGTYSFDFNAWAQTGGDAMLTPGQSVYCQYWSRDPADVDGVGLTDALEFKICP